MAVHMHRPSRVGRSGVLGTPGVEDWRSGAACRDFDPEIWFSVGSGPAAQEQDDRAKAICRFCRVREDCLSWALATNQPYGVWGGFTEDERRALKRRVPVAGLPGQRRCEDCNGWFTPADSGRHIRCAPCAAKKAGQWKTDYERSHR